MPKGKKRKAPPPQEPPSSSSREAATGGSDELSAYELARLANIKRNEDELRRLGLHLNRLTYPATGRQAPTKESRHSRAVPPRSRWSKRLLGKPAPNYKEVSLTELAQQANSSASASRSSKRSKAVRKSTAVSPSLKATAHLTKAAAPPKPLNPRSCKNLRVDLEHLDMNFLGKIIPPLGGQVKRAVMEEASANGSPKFSRMSGIQEWRNAVLLFVNVYGDSYKNVFLDGGRAITWFAQSRQWEGTPVIQRLINCEGGKNSDGRVVRQTPVLLFCRNLACGYVYCGRLGYSGHDPDRIPIRFIWELTDYDSLEECEPFRNLVDACGRVLNGEKG